MNFQEKINSIRSKNASTYRIITIDLSTARSKFEMAIAGAFIFGYAATDAAANINIKLNEDRNDSIPLSSQKFIEAVFYRLYVSNDAQAGKTITLAIATFDVNFFRVGDLTSGDIASIGEVTLNKKVETLERIKAYGAGSYNQVDITTAATLIKAAKSDRRSLVIENISDTDIYIGLDNAVTTATGLLLKANASIEFTYYNGTIYGIHGGTGNKRVSYIEIAES